MYLDVWVKKYKGFYINKFVEKKFKLACVDLDVNQGDVLELLVIKWLKKTKSDKKKMKLYEE